ncbi:MAG: sensor histidine kinase [Gammaproteobacteria bacterium]
MAPGFSTRRGALLYCLALGLLGTIFAGVLAAASAASLAAAIGFALPLTILFGVASGFSAHYLCRANPLNERGTVAIAARFFAAAVMAGLVLSGLGQAWNSLLGLASDGRGALPMSAWLKANIFGVGMLLYGLSAVAHYLGIEFERARNAEKRELQAALAAREADLRMLRTQIDPHFLFNSLNSISALTSIDGARARSMTLQLADFFRYSLKLGAQAQVTVGAEFDLLLRFLAIEEIRFGARLRVEHAIEDAARDCLLPPMLLQPLVENAVKHGIGQVSEGGVIAIAARRLGSQLAITVENTIDPDIGAHALSGIGLANVRQRLELAYGHEAGLNWQRTDARFRVELRLPAHTLETA